MVLGVHAPAEALRIAHGLVDDRKEVARDVDVRVHEDEHLARRIARSRVARAGRCSGRVRGRTLATFSRATTAVSSVLSLSTTMISTRTPDRARTCSAAARMEPRVDGSHASSLWAGTITEIMTLCRFKSPPLGGRAWKRSAGCLAARRRLVGTIQRDSVRVAFTGASRTAAALTSTPPASDMNWRSMALAAS